MNSWVAFGVGAFLGAVFALFALCAIAALFRRSWDDELEGQHEPRDREE